MSEKAVGIIDAQRGFMPLEEGTHLHRDGFGELPVTDGESIVPVVNRLLGVYATLGYDLFTTQDWHPYDTAHFSETPNFTTTWPRHCVDGQPGAELHPNIITPPQTERFTKGSEVLEHGEDDLSYSGYYAEDPTTGGTLPEWLKNRGIKEVLLGGLALDYCVGRTALDLRTKLGLDVIVAIDATRGINDTSVKAMLEAFDEHGITTTLSDEWIDHLEAA